MMQFMNEYRKLRRSLIKSRNPTIHSAGTSQTIYTITYIYYNFMKQINYSIFNLSDYLHLFEFGTPMSSN